MESIAKLKGTHNTLREPTAKREGTHHTVWNPQLNAREPTNNQGNP
jgi:hypothetical protein